MTTLYLHANATNYRGVFPEIKRNGFTVAIIPKDGGWVQVQYATCSKRDQYCKKMGRERAKTNYDTAQLVHVTDLYRHLKNIEQGIWKTPGYHVPLFGEKYNSLCYRMMKKYLPKKD